MPTAEDILKEDSPEAEPAAQRMSKVREIIELSEWLKHLIEQHPPPAGEVKCVRYHRQSTPALC
ncbi:hypothetical protein Hamer_G014410 [Homarus americanus]|uniref:Uncharacterized protein n=1 Tax=Homarus americanus TaxID=6706 RepID=A0A8J5MUC9_HOMAM|nr:hypothetical protein Hamer_G014410 [Homarus americanus]